MYFHLLFFLLMEMSHWTIECSKCSKFVYMHKSLLQKHLYDQMNVYRFKYAWISVHNHQVVENCLLFRLIWNDAFEYSQLCTMLGSVYNCKTYSVQNVCTWISEIWNEKERERECVELENERERDKTNWKVWDISSTELLHLMYYSVIIHDLQWFWTIHMFKSVSKCNNPVRIIRQTLGRNDKYFICLLPK